jgi:hypothetical protein
MNPAISPTTLVGQRAPAWSSTAHAEGKEVTIGTAPGSRIARPSRSRSRTP